jgi:hypothetical protein
MDRVALLRHSIPRPMPFLQAKNNYSLHRPEHGRVIMSVIFGDNGMISVVVCFTPAADTRDIDTWLMSCNVLGRKDEGAALSEILHHARAAGIHRLTDGYIPSDRNKLVDHYAKHGFPKIQQGRIWPDPAGSFLLNEKPPIPLHESNLARVLRAPNQRGKITTTASTNRISVNLNLGSRGKAASGKVLSHLLAHMALSAEGLGEAQSIFSHALVQFPVAPE